MQDHIRAAVAIDADRRAGRQEAQARAAGEAWLPRGLRWLLDHPRLLRLYVWRLPHRRRPTLVSYYSSWPSGPYVERYELLGRDTSLLRLHDPE